MSSPSVSAVGGEAGTRRARIRAGSSAFTLRQEDTTPSQNARRPTTCAPPVRPPAPLPAKGLRRQLARARGPRRSTGPGQGHSPSGCCFRGNTGHKSLQPPSSAGAGAAAGPPLPHGRRCLPAPPRPYLRERAGRRPAAAPAAPAAAARRARRPCRSRGPAGLPQRGRR